MSVSMRLRLVTIAAALSLGCGSSPTAPTAPDDVVLDSFQMDAQRLFAGLGFSYTLSGGIHLASGVTDQIALQQMTVEVLDQSGRAFMTFSGSGFPTTINSNVTISGAFAFASDSDVSRAAGATFAAHVTYARSGGSARTVTASGPIASRRPPA
jgi:hypothetical protein